MESPLQTPSLIELLRTTLQRVESTTAPDDPILLKLKQHIVIIIAELELCKDAAAAAAPDLGHLPATFLAELELSRQSTAAQPVQPLAPPEAAN